MKKRWLREFTGIKHKINVANKNPSKRHSVGTRVVS